MHEQHHGRRGPAGCRAAAGCGGPGGLRCGVDAATTAEHVRWFRERPSRDHAPKVSGNPPWLLASKHNVHGIISVLDLVMQHAGGATCAVQHTGTAVEPVLGRWPQPACDHRRAMLVLDMP